MLQEYKERRRGARRHVYSGEEFPISGQVKDAGGEAVDLTGVSLRLLVRNTRGVVYCEFSTSPLEGQGEIAVADDGRTFSCRLTKELTAEMVGLFVVEVKVTNSENETRISVSEPVEFRDDYIKRMREG